MLFSYYRRPLFLGLLFFAAVIVINKFFYSPPPADASLPYPVKLTGRIAQYPVKARKLNRFPLELSSIDNEPAAQTVMAYIGELDGASYGDTISFSSVLTAPVNYAIPGNLDWHEYLADRKIYYEARSATAELIKKARFPIAQAAGMRARSLQIFEENFPEEQASVLGGVVLGEKKSVTDALKTAFQDSGAMHILVASGSNVGFVTFIVYFLCSKLGIRKRYSGLLAFVCAGMYVLAAGLEAPLVRGYFMFSAALLGYLLDRDSGVFQAIVIACCLILITDPSSLFDAGFQMSFIASFGIAVGMTLWDKLVTFKGFGRTILRIVMVSFFAQIGLYPLMALYFHKISLISLFSNIILVPFSGVVMGLGFASLGFAWSPVLFGLMQPVTGFGTGLFIWLVKLFAGFKYASILISPPSVFMLAAYFLFVFVLIHAPLLGFNRRLAVLVAVSVSLIILAAQVPEKNIISLYSDSNTSGVILRGEKELLLFNPGMNGKKLANAVLYYGRRRASAVICASLERKNWSGLTELGSIIKLERLILPFGVLPDELSAALPELENAGTKIERVWPDEIATIGAVSVKALAKAKTGFAFTGRDQAGLDWQANYPKFAVTIMENGKAAELRVSSLEKVLQLGNISGAPTEYKF